MDDVIELTLHLHEETKTKIKVSESGFLDDAVWLPKRKIEYYHASDDMVEVRLSEELAEKQGLL
jgi:hypothetical protein